MNNDIAVCIPSIPVRREMLARAVCSVGAQTLKPNAIHIASDIHRQGAPKTRQRALDAVDPAISPWVAFLDDDDEMLPEHLEHLLAFALDGGYDYVYSWYKIIVGDVIFDHDPVFPATHFSSPWDPENPRQTTVTTLVRTELAQAVGFDTNDLRDEKAQSINTDEDWRFTLECNRRGRIGHLVEHTWLWHHDSKNTSGHPTRW